MAVSPSGAPGGLLGGWMQNFQNAPGNYMGMAGNLVRQGQQSGLFDPFGSPRLRALLRQRALQLGQAQNQSAQGYGQLYGLDPMQRRAAMANSMISGAGNVAGALNNAEYEGANANANHLWNLLGQGLSGQQQMALQQQQQRAQNSGGFGQILGGIAGSLIPGLGGIFGGGGGGRQPNYGSPVYDWTQGL
jgi:hypothetical protein